MNADEMRRAQQLDNSADFAILVLAVLIIVAVACGFWEWI